MSTHLVLVVIDANDPKALAQWWSEALRWPITFDEPEEVVVEPLGDLEDSVPALVFGLVPEPKTGKNRIHLDLATSADEDQAAIVARLLAAGATRADVGQTGDETWEVLADPEGNEFCVLQGQYEEGNPLAAICLDVVDPRAAAEYWTQASGWTQVEEDDEGIGLANPNGHRPNLDLLKVPEPNTVKNRIHLDVAPPADADQAAEVDRLLALGATRADVGQTGDETWVVLQDPEGNETCVLSARDLKGLGPTSGT
jgi:Glyoxalase-like domain